MKSYIETREGWWRNSRAMVFLSGLVISIILTLIILISGYVFGLLIFPGLCLTMDICLFSVLIFIVMSVLSMIWSAIFLAQEQLVIYRGEEDYVEGIVSSIEDSLKDSGIQYKHTNISSQGKGQQFKLIDLECFLNVTDKSDKIKPHAIIIDFLQVTRKNQREVDTIKSAIEDIMRNNDFKVYRDYKDLIRYYDSF
jgi:hypothetical protein